MTVDELSAINGLKVALEFQDGNASFGHKTIKTILNYIDKTQNELEKLKIENEKLKVQIETKIFIYEKLISNSNFNVILDKPKKRKDNKDEIK